MPSTPTARPAKGSADKSPATGSPTGAIKMSAFIGAVVADNPTREQREILRSPQAKEYGRRPSVAKHFLDHPEVFETAARPYIVRLRRAQSIKSPRARRFAVAEIRADYLGLSKPHGGRARRPATNGRARGSRRSASRSSGGGDPGDGDGEPEPPAPTRGAERSDRLCGCGCGESIEHLAHQARYLNEAHRKRAAYSAAKGLDDGLAAMSRSDFLASWSHLSAPDRHAIAERLDLHRWYFNLQRSEDLLAAVAGFRDLGDLVLSEAGQVVA